MAEQVVVDVDLGLAHQVKLVLAVVGTREDSRSCWLTFHGLGEALFVEYRLAH